MMMLTIIVFLSTVLSIWIQRAHPAALPGFSECMFNGKFYQVGESFHPVSDAEGYAHEACYNCTCQPTTIVHCEEVYCPPANCQAPVRVNGQCCPVCEESEVPSGPKQCVYEGLTVLHGNVFHPPSVAQEHDDKMQNSSAVSKASKNPFCTQCECNDGTVQCTDVSSECPTLACSPDEAILIDGSCCMECPTPPPSSTPSASEVCIDFDGRIYSEGDTWNPYYLGFGRVDCWTCTCVGGIADCTKDPCPEVPYCEPGEPVPDIVICCLECKPRPADFVPSAVPTTEQVFTETTEYLDSGTTAAVHSESETTTEESLIITPLLVPCRTKEYIINVYKHSTNDSLAIENSVTFTVDIYTWTPNDTGVLVKTIVSLDSITFQNMEDFVNFKFVGKTLLRRVNGLTTRESKRERIRNCQENCSSLVVNMLRPVDGVLECAEEN